MSKSLKWAAGEQTKYFNEGLYFKYNLIRERVGVCGKYRR
jgi:hypothetical protein